MESDLSFFRRRAAEEQAAASHARCAEAKRAHKVMAERYQDLIQAIETSGNEPGSGIVDDPIKSARAFH